MTLRMIVCGGRHWGAEKTRGGFPTRKAQEEEIALRSFLDRLRDNHQVDLLIQGGASGADSLAAQWARDRDIPVETFEADWKRYGRGAGPRRNSQMLKRLTEELPEGVRPVVVAFPGGRGTADMKRKAMAAGIDLIHWQDVGR